MSNFDQDIQKHLMTKCQVRDGESQATLQNLRPVIVTMTLYPPIQNSQMKREVFMRT